MISSILKAAGLITLLFGAWVFFTMQSGKDTWTGRLIDRASNLKTVSISIDNLTGEKKQPELTSGNYVAANSARAGEKDATQTEDNGGNRNKSIVQIRESASANLEGKAEDVKNEKAGLLPKTGHKENLPTDDSDKLFNAKTILPEDPEERITAAGEKRAPARGTRMTALNTSKGRFDTDAKEPTDEQLQSAQKRLAESIIKLETTINDFWRR